jgi:hypothetical protein
MREQIIAFLQTMLPDNALRTITAQRLRDFFTEFIHAFIFVPRGNFLLGTQYEKNDLVVFDGSSFYCKQANNDKPVSNIDFWGLLASKGDTGAPKWRGAWSSATAYAIGDSVSQNGNSYISKTAHTNQAVTNTTHWDIVAAKGESGDRVDNFGGSLIPNGTFEGDTFSGWSLPLNFTNESIGSFRAVTTGVLPDNCVNNIFFPLNTTRLTKIEAKTKCLTGSNAFFGMWGYDFQGNLVIKSNGGVAALQSYIPNTPNFIDFVVYLGGVGIASSNFGANAVKAKVVLVGNNNTIDFARLIVSETPLSEAVPSNLPWLPAGQAVFDNTNPLKKGTYINSTVGIVWHTVKEITLQPNGTSVVFNIRRTYKFAWVPGYNDGVTIVSQPPATVNANTDALLTLTGTVGKTLTIQIQQIA